MSKTTICILIMCTNEEHIIGETLKSTLPYATDYIICDNASTDNTIQVCLDFFKEFDVKGQIFNYHWVDFGHNYSYLYELAYKHTKSEYWWQIDADDLIHQKLDVTNLTKDKYFLQFGETLKYTRPQIFKNNLQWKHYLKIHGYIDTLPKGVPHTKDTVNGDYYIECRHLGNRHKTDFKTKYLNDSKMLQDDINDPTIDHNDKTRCWFYLGQSYMCAHDYENSIKAYINRIKLGGRDEEVFISMVNIGQCYQALSTEVNDEYFKKALSYYIDSWKFRKTRSEGLYKAVTMLRQAKLFEEAYKYVTIGKHILVPQDTLFVNTEGYLWGFDYELSIICFYLNKFDEGKQAIDVLLKRNDLPVNVKNKTLINSQYYN